MYRIGFLTYILHIKRFSQNDGCNVYIRLYSKGKNENAQPKPVRTHFLFERLETILKCSMKALFAEAISLLNGEIDSKGEFS